LSGFWNLGTSGLLLGDLTALDDWLTVYRSVTLVNFQLDAQNSVHFYI